MKHLPTATWVQILHFLYVEFHFSSGQKISFFLLCVLFHSFIFFFIFFFFFFFLQTKKTFIMSLFQNQIGHSFLII